MQVTNMNKKKCLLFILATFILMMQQIRADAQLTNVNWSQPINHPCYKGLSISVSNMGWSDDVKAYLWGVRIINNYDIPVSFRYLLTVGNEKKSLATNYFAAAWKLKPGDTLTDGGNVFTANIYKDPSADWTLMIGDVCFDGMRCGAPDNCFADCDVQFRKPNQLCGLSASAPLNAPDNKIEPSAAGGTQTGPAKEKEETPNIGETSNWKRDDETVEVNMGKTEEGIYWKRKKDKQYSFFKKSSDGSYMFKAGTDTYSLKFASAAKVGFYKNNVLENYYTLDGEEDDGSSKVRSGLWSKSFSNAMVRITVTKDGLTYHYINNSSDDGSPFYKRISATEYRLYQADGILYDVLILEEDGRLHHRFTDKPGSFVVIDELVFRSAEEEKKPTDELNGDNKYNFKGTTLWKRPGADNIKVNIAIVDQQFYNAYGIGFPRENIEKHRSYIKVAPDTYRFILAPMDRKTINDSIAKFGYKFISTDRLVDEMYYTKKIDIGYYKKVKRGQQEFIVTGQKDTLAYYGDTLVFVATLTPESLPQKGTTQIVTPADATGTWRSEDKSLASIEDLKVRITPLGENMLCNFGKEDGRGKKTFTYKKVAPNTYEYKEDNGAIGRLLFLSPDRICFWFVYKNYVSIGYFNKPAAAPIVKQEDKPAPVTENKTTSEECSDLNGKWERTRINDIYTGPAYLTIKTTTYGLMVSYADWPNPLFKKISSNSYKWAPTRAEYAGGYQLILRCQGDGSIRLYQYRADGSDVGGYDEFIKK